MRKVLTAITVAAILAITSSAMAGGVKVPKLMCLSFGLHDIQLLAFKASGTILNNGSKVKTYAITGSDFYGPISGSGFMSPGTAMLQATYSGMTLGSGRLIHTYSFSIDLGTGSGTINYRTDYPDGTIDDDDTSATIVDCAGLSIPD